MTANADALASKLLLGRYRVVRLLGEGGMGTVHLARVEGAEGFTRPVVVKRMRRDIRASDEGNRLFIREAKILSKMQHPSIAGIIDFGVEDGAHIMVLEYVHGYTLAPWLDYRAREALPLPVDICLFIVRRVLDALHYAHHFDTEEGQEVEIVHRDVAPDNVLLSNKGYVHLLDFGVASMRGPQANNSTKAGVFRGKLGYAAPETVQGEAATPRADQYSAAVLLLELLTQVTPFVSDSMGETVVRMVNEIPEPPSRKRDDIPPGLDQALARALAKKPEERFESALAFSRQLKQFQSRDDEEVAQQLKSLVREDFEVLPSAIGVEPLKVREEALAQVMPVTTEETVHREIVPSLATVRSLALPRSAAAVEPVLAPVRVSSGATAPNQKRLHGLLLGLVVVGGLIALGLGAAVALLQRGSANVEQVVVVGERAPQDNTPELSPQPANPAQTGQDEQVSPQPLPEATARTVAEPRSLVGKSSASPEEKAAARSTQLSSAVQKKSGSFQACFTAHLDDAEKAAQAVLHFSVAKAGGSAQVEVEPITLATTSLGGCLKQAAIQVQFPPLDEPVAFRVPVRARVARAKDQK